jgi:hypothetical protein
LNRVCDCGLSVASGDDCFTGESVPFNHRLRLGGQRPSEVCKRAVSTDRGVGIVDDPDQNELASVVSRRKGGPEIDRGIVG